MKSIRLIPLFILVLFALSLSFGCDSGDDDDDNDSGDGSGDDDDDNESGPVDDDSRADTAPVALVVTTEDLVDSWQVYADWKDRTGMRTEVVAIEDVLGTDVDDPAALKSYLVDAYAQGVTYVLFGGDADQIPYQRGYTEVWAGTTYYGNAPIQTYYESLDIDWNADNDETVGEQNQDITVEQMRDVQISVGRVPVETPEEVEGYVNKLILYETGAGEVAQRATCPLFLADVAASVPLVGDIDGGMTHEQVIRDYLPDNFKAGMRRLYGTELYANLVGAEVGTNANIMEAFQEEGYTLAVGNAHGSFTVLTMALDWADAAHMESSVPFVFLTTSCLSGNFADKAYGNGDNPPQTDVDSVAEELVKNPLGGAVAYLGNTLIGLGPAGGVQVNHSIIRAIFNEGDDILGDAMMNMRRTLYSEVASVNLGDVEVPFPMDLFPGLEWYTQRSTILLGDPALRIWTQVPGVLSIEGPSTLGAGYNVIDVVVSKNAQPTQGIPVSLSVFGGVLINKTSDANGAAQFLVNLNSGDIVSITAYQRQMTAGNQEYIVP